MKIYFPPRIIDVELQNGDVNAALDHATTKYLEPGVAILVDEANLRSCIKIINFADSFPDLRAPTEPEAQGS